MKLTRPTTLNRRCMETGRQSISQKWLLLPERKMMKKSLSLEPSSTDSGMENGKRGTLSLI